jgi:hypothetical protein
MATTTAPATAPAPKTDAQKIEKLRAQANDKSIPQDIRNEMLDKANALEYKLGTSEKKYAKGGMATKAMAKKALVKMLPKAVAKAPVKAPVKAMAKGGSVKRK